jgi:hypothetical protein
MCVANVLIKEGYRPCLLKFGDIPAPTKQNVTDRELDPTKPQSTGNDEFKTQLSTETLTLVTINIEGFHGNQVYLQTLANRADILLLQEHWLHTFEKHKLDDFLPDYVCLTKCFDDCIVQDPIMRLRGHGGVAICIHNKYEHLIEPIPDPGNRIVGVRLNTDLNNSVSAIWYWFNQVCVLIVNTDCYTAMPSLTHYWILNYAVIKTLG